MSLHYIYIQVYNLGVDVVLTPPHRAPRRHRRPIKHHAKGKHDDKLEGAITTLRRIDRCRYTPALFASLGHLTRLRKQSPAMLEGVLCDSDAPSSLEKQIGELLEALHTGPQNAEPFAKLMPLAHQYVLLHVDVATNTAISPEDARFKAHQFCHRCATDRKLADAKRSAEQKFRFLLQTCMLRVHSYKLKRPIQTWLSGLGKTIFDCIDCYQGYLRAKQSIGPKFLHTYSPERIDHFLDFVLEWEERTAMAIADASNVSGESSKEPLTLDQTFSIVDLAGVLKSTNRTSGLYDLIKRGRKYIALNKVSEAPCGLLAFAIDDEESTRTWAEMQWAVPPMSHDSSINRSKVLGNLVRQAVVKKYWNGFAFLVKMAPDAFAGAALPNTLLDHLTDDTGQTASILVCIQRLLQEKGAAFWSHEDREFPLVVLSSILDSNAFIKCLANNHQNNDLWRWTITFIETLADRLISRHGTAKVEDADAKVYEEALKRLMHLLLERFQQGTHPQAAKAAAARHALQILEACVVKEKEASRTSHSWEALSRVFALHAPFLASMAFKGGANEISGVKWTSNDVETTAKSLIETVFSRDCESFSKSLLNLSEKAAVSQQAYKRATKSRQKTEASKTIEEDEVVKAVHQVFETTAERLELGPNICAELWKAAFHASRDGSGLEVFLRPLSRIAALTEPQINSHIILVKDRHANLPSYVRYKDRLKAVILSHTRKIGTMRSNLPGILLEACEVSSTQSQQTDADPTLICHKFAEGILAANLCPQQDVHKAAQNIVRAAFEEAESRGDCFRSLIQCNPCSSLKGINDFLANFIMAASTLVEANDAAKWMVRSFSDILEALCSETDGLLHHGTSGSLLDRQSTLPQIQKELQRLWTLMSKSIAVIFKRTPHWARVLPHAELTAWFRDVSLFARQAIAEMAIIKEAITAGNEARKFETRVCSEVLDDLALPLEEACSWLRMNNAEIVRETREYFVEGLTAFRKEGRALPEAAKKRMLDFIDAQMKITNDDERMTLLSLVELRDLRHLIEPQPETYEIIDSDEDDDFEEPPLPKERQAHVGSGNPVASPVEGMTPSRKLLTEASAKTKPTSTALGDVKPREKQSKLQFGQMQTFEALKKPFVSKSAPVPPQPRFASSAGTANKYQSAGSRPSAPVSSAAAPSKSMSKLAQMRQDFKAANSRPVPLAPRAPAAHSRELPEPAGPEAKRSFASTIQDTGKHQIVPAREQNAQSSDESDSSDDEPKVGLADMGEKIKSPIKVRPRPRFVPQQPPRRTILIEDIEARRAQKEREEAERKRKLREPANFNALHRTILSWPFWTESERPPQPSGERPQPYEKIRQTYRSAEDYIDVFSPMLHLECWAELQASREQIKRGNTDFASFTATVSGRTSTDRFVVLTMTLAEDRRIQGRPLYQDTDVLFLRAKEKNAKGQAKTILGKVQAYKNDPKGPRLTVRCNLSYDNQQMSSILVTNAVIEVGRLFTLTTLHREYEALHALSHFDLLPNILLARAATKENFSVAEVKDAEKTFGVNEPQAEAIISAIKAGQGFHLIQGPPGTGKTKTIASLVVQFIRNRKPPAIPIRNTQGGAKSAAAPPVKQKILLCAPSNAAIDEVAKRVNREIKLSDGRFIKPNVVRVGREDAIHSAVKEIHLDSIVEQKIGSNNATDSHPTDPAQLHIEIRMLKEQRDAKRAEIEVSIQGKKSKTVVSELEAQLRNLTSKRMEVMNRLDEVKDKKQTVARQFDADRRRIQQEVLMQADVVCATLGGAGHPTLNALPFDFETVIIDEAAQAVELDTLIPLRYGCKKCIMVGDPNQLPPTVISREAERLNYSQSLFVRLFENANNHSHLLSIQYRMNPCISAFPNIAFYQSRLKDGPSMAEKTARPWHNDPLLKPLRFVNCRNGTENTGRGGLSFSNRNEAELAAAIYERLHREARRSDLGALAVEGKVGVVTMYKEQVFELRKTFNRVFGNTANEAVEFNTVDGFQGQEKDIIILSCVRTSGIGFLNDFRRINVAITRAKSNLFVIGDVANLERNDRDGFWRKSIEAARQNGDLISAGVSEYRRPAFAHLNPGQLPSPSKNGEISVVSSPSNPLPAASNGSSPSEARKRAPSENADESMEKFNKKRKLLKGQNSDSPLARKDSSNPQSLDTQERPRSRPPGPPPARPVQPTHADRSSQRSSTDTAMTSSSQSVRPAATRIAIPGQEAPTRPRTRPRPPPRPYSLDAGPNQEPLNPRAVAASRPPPRPRPRPPPQQRNSRDDGPSDRARASLFIPKRPRP